MKPDTITAIPACLNISSWAYHRMGVHCCNRIGISLYGCNCMSASPWGGRRFTKPAVNIGVATSILTLYRVVIPRRQRRQSCCHYLDQTENPQLDLQPTHGPPLTQTVTAPALALARVERWLESGAALLGERGRFGARCARGI